jgi:cytochrome c
MLARSHTLRCALVGLCLFPLGPLGPLVAHAQPAERGQALVESRCFACHSLDAHRVGPALRGVLGRPAGKAEGYAYSQALGAATHTWNATSIKAWLSDPESVVPGQAMNYRVDPAQDREDIVAYLLTLSAATPSAAIRARWPSAPQSR